MITAYLKPTNFCSLGCGHCYLPDRVRADRTRMSWETLERTAGFLAEMAGNQPVHVFWHDGEPLMMPVDWFRKAGTILDSGLPGHTESLQTSLIPYKSEHAALMHERFGGVIGSSIDFRGRRIGGSVEAYHDLWMSKVARARAGGLEIIPTTVPTRNELGSEGRIVEWFIERGFRAFNVERYNAFGLKAPDRPSNGEHAGFLRHLFDALMAKVGTDGQAPRVGVIVAAMRGILNGAPGERWGGACQSRFLVVEPDGALNTCPDRTAFEVPFGNIANGYPAFSTSMTRRRWVREQSFAHTRAHCQGCPHASWCRSGCPLTGNGAEDGEDECSGYRSFLDHVCAFCEGDGRTLAGAYLERTRRWTA